MGKRRNLAESEIDDLWRSRGLERLDAFKAIKKPIKSRCLTCGNTLYRSFFMLTRRNTKGEFPPNYGCDKCIQKTNEDSIKRFLTNIGFELVGNYVPNRRKYVECKCMKCSRLSKKRLCDMQRGNNLKCWWCVNKIPTQEEAAAKFAAYGYQLIGEYVKSATRVDVIHTQCGAIGKKSLNELSRSTLCNACSDSYFGFDPKKRSMLYLISHPQLNAIKLGISNCSHKIPSHRITTHKEHGWVICFVWTYQDGSLAAEHEKLTLKWMRKDLKLPIWLSSKDMPQGGFTETCKYAGYIFEPNATHPQTIMKYVNNLVAVSCDGIPGRQILIRKSAIFKAA